MKEDIIINCSNITSNALNEIFNEYESASSKYPDFNSAHEGYAVILEELDELWDEIKKKKPNYDKMYNEAKQVAAMALRFMMDVYDDSED